MILRDVDVHGRRVDVEIDGTDVEIDGAGGALLPGLHDHHIHVQSLAARDRSVDLTGADLNEAITAAAADTPPGEWIRVVGYDDHLGGRIDREDLDRLAPNHLVRVQHRSGHEWVLSSAALQAVGLTGDGRVRGADAELRELWGAERPDLAPVGRRLAGYGITAVTDATVSNGPDEAELLAEGLPQRVTVMGGPDLSGHRKLVVAEYEDPDPDGLAESIRAAHAAQRPVAIHAASRPSLVLALAALEAAGVDAGDRIEHASVAPPELVGWIARLGVRVVTQPNFVADHGDRYLADVDADDQPWLYRGRGFLDAGVPLAAGSDAPFGSDDPWLAMRAAVDRRTAGGAVLGPDERLTPEEALALYTGPGGADRCLLRVPWAEARHELTADLVAATIIGGEVVYDATRR